MESDSLLFKEERRMILSGKALCIKAVLSDKDKNDRCDIEDMQTGIFLLFFRS